MIDNKTIGAIGFGNATRGIQTMIKESNIRRTVKNENEILMYCHNRAFTGRTLLLYKLIEYNRTIIGM